MNIHKFEFTPKTPVFLFPLDFEDFIYDTQMVNICENLRDLRENTFQGGLKLQSHIIQEY